MAHVRSSLRDSKSAPRGQARGKKKEIIKKDGSIKKPQTEKKSETDSDKMLKTSEQSVSKRGRKSIAKVKPQENIILKPLKFPTAKNRDSVAEKIKSKFRKNKTVSEKIKHNFQILAQELLIRQPNPNQHIDNPVKSHIGCIQREPQVITMKPKVKKDSIPEPTCSKQNRMAKHSEKSTSGTSIFPEMSPFENYNNVAYKPTIFYRTVEEDGKVWTIPEPVQYPPVLEPVHNEEEYPLQNVEKGVLPVNDVDHKVEKIEDMRVLREMLKLNKIQLSNGVQISLHSAKQPVECDYCGKTFRAKTDLTKHMYIHLDIKPFNCPQCDKCFRQRGNLKTHITRMHPKYLKKPEIFICHFCDKQFFVKEAIRAHVLTHVTEKQYACHHCGKKYATDVLLRNHIKVHIGDCRFYCSLCSASYASRTHLNKHIKTHLGIKDHMCHVCGKSFSRTDCIQSHMACFHENEKRFQCPICHKKLKGHLTEHMRTHMQSKPYACLECGRRFAQRSQLAVHKRSHTGIKPYQCRVCKRPFTHSNALQLHVRRHTGEKPFECAMCPQSFSQLPHMKSHMIAIHKKYEAYKCQNCGEFFKLKSTLNIHQQRCQAPEDLSWKNRNTKFGSMDPSESTMSLSRMRFLLAILLRTIADENRLKLLGFNKRLIDDLLIDSLEATGHKPCKDDSMPPAKRLKTNIQLLLNWTVPQDVMKRFKKQKKTTEQLLEELTS